LSIFGIGAAALPFAVLGGYRFTFATILSLLGLAGSIAFSFIILPGLSKRTKKVWNLMYYFSWFGVLMNVISLNIGGIIIGGIISFWLLFQLRNKYTN